MKYVLIMWLMMDNGAMSVTTTDGFMSLNACGIAAENFFKNGSIHSPIGFTYSYNCEPFARP